ncbi:enoyl-ACP reductase FabV [Photobacterium rosenbergii]|uniref:trans-2-enoyl-CoA reductase (NAD(+)) n=1 Tax=Photobacterium rosenbergii TaxID=294936 RepID=A0ABU3ZNX1_9GAMM|nr:enoyl-ACP reductase FabV [Photobacterium rosenbergii]MDV5171769.1 trans-2-enoyl-CoA reductase family protein [Photobacterium rosenbergii]
MKPIIKGVIAKNCNPEGCKEAVQEQINEVLAAKPINNAPKKVLVIGASSGLGLGSRVSLAFGGNADTIGISFERPPSEDHTGTAGWHNNIAFTEAAEAKGLIAKNFVGDAFSPELRKQVIEYVKNEFGGKLDCVVYSLATGVRPNPEGGMWQSSLKALGQPFTGNFINIEKEAMVEMTLPVASEEEVNNTVKVMGGEDWQEWISCLKEADVLEKGVKTVAYSYIGSEITYPVYFGGTLGKAKQHLHATADDLDAQLKDLDGGAYVGICKSIVSKASVFIPGLSSYMLALFKLLKERGEYETCAEHMHRLMTDFLYNEEGVQVDDSRLLRPDNYELNPEVQEKVKEMMAQITHENFKSPEVGDYQGFVSEFMKINGFAA